LAEVAAVYWYTTATAEII